MQNSRKNKEKRTNFAFKRCSSILRRYDLLTSWEEDAAFNIKYPTLRSIQRVKGQTKRFSKARENSKKVEGRFGKPRLTNTPFLFAQRSHAQKNTFHLWSCFCLSCNLGYYFAGSRLLVVNQNQICTSSWHSPFKITFAVEVQLITYLLC